MRRDLMRRVALAVLTATVVASMAGCTGARSGATGGVTSLPPEIGSAGTSSEGLAAKTDSARRLAATSGSQGSYAGAAEPAQTKAAGTDKLVVRNGNLRLEVTKVPEAVKALRKLAAKYGGSVADLELASDDGGSPEPASDTSRKLPSGLPYSGSATIRVPVAKLDAFRDEVERLGKVLSERAADEDVTQQHADLAARLKNAEAEEAHLRSFFEKARSVADMLSIERELGRVRGEIESMTAQLLTMERQAAMATLTVELVEPKPIVRPAGIDWGFGEAVTTGVQGLAALLQAALVVLITGSPLWAAAVAAFLVIRWRVNVRRRQRTEAAA